METGNNSCCQIQKPVNTRYSCQIKTCIHNISHDSTHSVQSMYINNPDDCRLRREERNCKQSKRYDLTKCKQKGWNHTGVRSSILRHSLMFTLKTDKKKKGQMLHRLHFLVMISYWIAGTSLTRQEKHETKLHTGSKVHAKGQRQLLRFLLTAFQGIKPATS